jgi:hypothetical protein
MLYLCEKYAPFDSLERYQSEKDISVTGAYIQHETSIMRDEHFGGSGKFEVGGSKRARIRSSLIEG